jgi:hypothetical protein
LGEARARRERVQGGVRTVEVIVMKIVMKEGSAMIAGPIRSGIGPFTSDGLDEALGLAVGLGAIGFGKAVFDAELLAGGGEEFGAISGTAIGQDALDSDAVSLVEADGLVEGVEDAGDLFVGPEAGESKAGVIVDGDVQRFDAGAWVALGAITGGPNAGACETAQLLDVEVEKLTRRSAFVAQDWGLWRFESGESVEVVAAEHAGQGGLGDGENHEDLGIGAALPAQGEDAGFELWAGFARLATRDRGMVFETVRKTGLLGALEPAADGLLAHGVSRSSGAKRETVGREMGGHLGSHQRGKSGISVHVVRAGGRWVECLSTTILTDPFRADNVLKHDT